MIAIIHYSPGSVSIKHFDTAIFDGKDLPFKVDDKEYIEYKEVEILTDNGFLIVDATKDHEKLSINFYKVR